MYTITKLFRSYTSVIIIYYDIEHAVIWVGIMTLDFNFNLRSSMTYTMFHCLSITQCQYNKYFHGIPIYESLANFADWALDYPSFYRRCKKVVFSPVELPGNSINNEIKTGSLRRAIPTGNIPHSHRPGKIF